MELNMPTFERIDGGYLSYKVQGRFLGLDDDGASRYANSHKLEVIIDHNYYDCLFKLYIKLDKKDKPCRFILRPTFINKYDHEFEYSCEGYKKLKEDLTREIQWLRRITGKLFNVEMEKNDG